MWRERSHPSQSCIICDACDGTRFKRPWCSLRKHYVWASGWCERFRQKGKMAVEE